jgi:hypothetical protein
MQFQMLTKAGVPGEVVASGLAATSVLTAAMVMALPVLAIPAVLTGAPIDRQLVEGSLPGSSRSSCWSLSRRSSSQRPDHSPSSRR